MDEYIEVNEVAGGRPEYRLNRVQMERRGRGRSIATTFMLFVALLVLQLPLRRVADGAWEVAFVASRTVDLPVVVVAARLSLLVDLVMIGVYLALTWRSLELMWAWERRSKLRRVAYAAAIAVVIGAVMDLAEDVVLWIETGAPDWQGDLSVPWTGWMRWFVCAGLVVVLLVALDSWRRWGKPPLDTGDGAEKGEEDGTDEAEKDQLHRIICCSGGGVRSAAFCLGGLQELTDRGLYADTDHVIGVSGGGYIAAAYHTVRWHSGDSDDDANWEEMTPPAFAPGTPEVQRLRRNSSYLLDSGNSALQGLLSLLFGIVVNLVLLTAVLGATAWLLGWYLVASGGLSGWHTATAASLEFTFGPWQEALWIWLVPAFGVALFVLERVVEKYLTIPFDKRMPIRRLSGALITYGTLLTLLLLGVPTALEWMHNFAASSGSAAANLLHALGFVPNDVCIEQLKQGTPKKPATACGVTSTMSLTTGVAAGELGGRASAPWVSVGGAMAVLTAVLAVARSARGALGGDGAPGAGRGAGLGALLAKVWLKVKDVVLPWAATVTIAVVLLVLLLRWTAGLVAVPEMLASWDLALGFLATLLALRLLTDVNRTSLHHFYRERLSFAFIVQRSTKAAGPLSYRKSLRFSQSRPPETRPGPRLVACAVANINDPGVVPVNRGCAPFVFDDTQIGLTDQQLPSGVALTPSAFYEYAADRRFRDATIPAAMAMSGAAFSPLAGRQNKRLNPYRLVLALANARLGVWLPNPLWIDNLATVRRLVRTRNEPETLRAWPDLSPTERKLLVKDYLNRPDQRWLWDLLPDPGTTKGNDPRFVRPPEWQQPEPQVGGAPLWLSLRVAVYRLANAVIGAQSKPGPSRLLKEAVGRTSIYDRKLYITDGGHYDNLGLVEALRRRPKEIIVLDASADPEDTFRALGEAIATARMDLNCEVTFDPRSMRRLTAERSTAAWGNGHYRFDDDNTEGVIRMVKVIMVEGLPWDVEAYSGNNPKFPRTGTGDQLYDEFDLEAYRILGREVTKKLIANPPPKRTGRLAYWRKVGACIRGVPQ
ncbi:patatin-like phospholipase family protein [Janibacter cremeus]|uniref:PNPLA domain-containing protein n=1 Tax=Janibacter cremeus TaxID=1285192 RepID=A0A852VV03_9MICO|nr:patatin-like phospholipase family protein [Janibacter cremeus]NYF98114.1 hypothetical protein [Janibacter cremeus]